MIKHTILLGWVVVICSGALGQQACRVEQDVASASFSLINVSSGKTMYADCQSIELVSDTGKAGISELYIISRKGKLIVLDGANSTVMWQRSVRKDASTHERADYNGIHELVAYTPERREAILFSANGVIYPPQPASEYPDDFQPIDSEMNYFSVGVVDRSTRDYQEGVVDRTGVLIIPVEFDNVEKYLDDVQGFLVQNEKLWGVVNRAGSALLPVKYDAIVPANGRFVASIEDRVGVISPTEELLPFVFEFRNIRNREAAFRNGKFNLLFNGNSISIDTSAQVLADARNFLSTYKSYAYYNRFVTHYDERTFSDENFVWRIVDSVTGRETIPKGYSMGVEQDIVELRGGVAVSKDGKFGVLNIETGEPMIPLEYDIPYVKGTGLFKYSEDAFYARVIRFDMQELSDTNVAVVVRREGKCGLVNLRGEVIFPFIYDEIYPDSRCEELNLILVKQAGRYGMIDEKTFELVIPCEYEAVMDCAKGKRFLGDRDYVPLTRK